MDTEEFRRQGHALIDWIADYRDGLRERPVRPDTRPGVVRAAMPAEAPVEGEAFADIVSDLDRLVAPNLLHWQHPRFFGFFPGNSLLAGVLGDLASTGLGVLGLSWQSAPALTEIEQGVTDWVRRMVGLSDAWRGVITDTASAATLVALVSARERATGYAGAKNGLQGEKRELAVYVTEQSHSSVEKAALLAGFGRDQVRRVACDGEGAMRADALADAVAADADAGRRPCAVVATTGTTATTALDPVAAIAAVAAERGLWLHVDAALAGSAMILPECRWMWDGVERADSVVLNPHKWLGAPFDCSLHLVRDPEHLVRVMSTNPSYLRSAMDDLAPNLRDWGVPLGRRFRALKLWFLLREQGVAALQARLRRDLGNARRLADAVAAAPDWRVVTPVPLQTVCVRHEPDGLAGDALDRHTLGWAEAVNRSGRAFLTPATFGGRWMVRVSIGTANTEWADVEATWALMREAAEDARRCPTAAA